jgi:hypothetical protein
MPHRMTEPLPRLLVAALQAERNLVMSQSLLTEAETTLGEAQLTVQQVQLRLARSRRRLAAPPVPVDNDTCAAEGGSS